MTDVVSHLRWSLEDVATVTGGKVVGDQHAVIHAVTTDSRSVPERALFVALKGEHHDGHLFVDSAIANGAVAALVEFGADVDAEPSVRVDDTLVALRDLAAARRDEILVPVIAVTGSTGKTSTKDLLVGALPDAWGSPRSYNNEVGVPLTVLGTPAGARYVVIEVGSRGAGHIEWLGPAVRPDVAVVTNIGVVHLETFGSVEALADAKWELVDLLDARGVAVLPADEPRLMRNHAGATRTFGLNLGDVHVVDITADDAGFPTFSLRANGEEATITLRLAGAHQAINAAAAAAAALAVGAGFYDIAGGLESATGSAWRMEVHRGTFTVVNDAYNANPQSMDGALRTVARMPGRHIAVLGEMAELGTVTDEEHRRIGSLARELGYSTVITVGPDHGLRNAAGDIAIGVDSVGDAFDAVRTRVGDGDVVLVKASRSVGLETLAADLVAEAAP